MNHGIWNKKIPTIAALFIVVVSIWVTTLISQRQISFTGTASPDFEAQNIQITNITDTSFTVQFTTKEKTVGVLTVLGEEETLHLDIRANGDQNAEFYAHRVEVKNLKPETQYSFSLIVNNKTVLDQESPFLVKTAPQLPISPGNQKTIKGKVLLPDGSASSDTAIFVSLEGSQKLSTLTGDNGEYSLPLIGTRNTSLDTYFTFTDSSIITLDIYRQNLKSRVVTQYKDAETLPVILLGADYDFSYLPKDVTAIEKPSGALNIPIPSIEPGEIEILSPRNYARFTDPRPLFQGSALPNSKVKIVVNSNNASEVTVTANRSGLWSFRPKGSLPPGENTITIETVDAFGIIKRITHSFTVFASGSQVEQTATPSATPVITLTPTTAITTTPILTPSPTAIAISPTSTMTPTPTSVTEPPSQKPTGTISKPGGTTSSFILTIISALFIIAGTTLLFIFG